MRVVKRYLVSSWLLIVIFSCIAAYLTFPSPLDPLSFALWPTEAGPHWPTEAGLRALISYTISGTTTYPGIVSLNITVTNNDIIAHDYAIVALIGSKAAGLWWGPSWYRDNLSPATDVQNISDPWLNQAFILTGWLNPGQSSHVVRKIEIPNDVRIKDVLVQVYDKRDASTQLTWNLKLNVINQ